MNKKLLLASLTTLLVLIFTLGIAAADVTVGSGKQYTTLDKAIAALDGNGGTVTVYGAVTVSSNLTVPEQANDLTIKAADGGSLNITASTVTFAKNENANVITLNLPVTTSANGLLIFGGFNSIVFGDSFVTNGTVNFYGGVDAESGKGIYTNTYVEEHKASNEAAITTLPYSITVNNGNFGIFAGGNRRAARECVYGSIAAKLDVTVNGGTFSPSITYGVGDALKLDGAFSLSGQSILADDATLTINGGTFNTPIYANAYIGINYTTASAASQVTNSSKDYYATDGDITVTVNGGTFTEKCFEISALQTAAAFNRLTRGNFTVSIGENALLADGIIIDATQVKAYDGDAKYATLSYANSATAVAKNFDIANGCENITKEPTRIACIGDSITQGTGSGTFDTKSYPAQLYTKLVGEGMDVIVSNYGCGGTKVANVQGLYYRDGLAYTISVNETDADIVILGLGINDRGFVGNTVSPRALFREEYQALIESYTNNPNTEKLYATTATYCYEYANEISQIVRFMQKDTIESMADEGNEKVAVIDLFELLLEDFIQKKGLGSDKLHPTAAGYTVYMNAIYNAIFADEPVMGKPLEKSSDIYVDQANGTIFGKGTKDDPIKHLTIAYEMADRDADVVTIHIVGTYTDDNLTTSTPSNNTPLDLKKLRIVGEPDANGNKAKWILSSKYFLFNCDTELDNLIVQYSGNTVIYFFGCFNSITFGENFETASHRYALFVAGHNVYNDDPTGLRYTTAEDISSDKDITINILGGKFLYVIAGNRHYNSADNAGFAPYGTYSGNMVFNVGENVFISHDSDSENALCGMNYLTGTITANINSWGEGIAIREYSEITKKSSAAENYDESNNTGKVIINLGENVNNSVIRSGDLNGDGNVDMLDTMTILKYLANGIPSDYDARYFYDRTEFSLIHVLRSLKKLAN